MSVSGVNWANELRPVGRTALAVGAAAVWLAAGFPRLHAAIVSEFEETDEGWRVIDLADTFGAGPYLTVVRDPVRPAYAPSNGNPGAALLYVDTPGNSFFFQAPAKFLGNVAAGYGLKLAYDLASSQPPPGNWYVEADVILKGTNGTILTAQVVNSAPAQWATYGIALHESNWHRDNLTGANPTQEEFRAVLSGLKSLWIRGEHFYGTDSSYLDNVRLEQAAGPPPPPTLAVELSAVVRLTATVRPGVNYAVEASADLIGWQEIASFNSAQATHTVTRERVEGLGQFYRIVPK